jgi:NDP-sugar pyrophosphorylase family protein
MIDPSILRAIFPVGGEAKRLRPLTLSVSKACVRLLNRPIIEFSMESLSRQGIRNFIFGVKGYLNYRSLFDYFREGIGFSAYYGIEPRVHIKYQPNIPDVGSADSIGINLEYYDIQGPVLGIQGDSLFDVDLPDMLSFHEKKNATMTIVLTPVERTEEYGVADLEADMRIRRFVEKPSTDEAPSRVANTGLYLLSPKIREVFKGEGVRQIIKKRKRLDFGMDMIPYLVDEGFPVYGYVLKGAWFDVGTPERYLDAMVSILHGGLKMVPDFGGRIDQERRIYIQGTSTDSIRRREKMMEEINSGRIQVQGSALIGRHTTLGNGTTLVNSNIDNFCILGEGICVERSAVLDRCFIGDGAAVQGSIVSRHSYVNSSKAHPTEISSLSVIGDDVTVGEGSRIIASKIWPGIEVPAGSVLISKEIKRPEELQVALKSKM